MDVNTALQDLLKTALIHDGLARGLREAAQALDKCPAHLCVLASTHDEPMCVKLVGAEYQINPIEVDDSIPGEWVGLCKIDLEEKPRKVVGCSCVVVKDYGQSISGGGCQGGVLQVQERKEEKFGSKKEDKYLSRS